MDLPTYTNIWRIEKRLYKLYDFRLPAPLPITWIGVFAGITVPYVIFLIAVGLPFNHNLVWLYVLPPGVLTWLTTRPVIESKRLPELVSSQLRYVSEPRTWCRMAPFAEKDEIMVSARVWHRHPTKARPSKGRPRKAEHSPVRSSPRAPARQVSGARPARTGIRVPRPSRLAAQPLAAAPPRAAAPALATAQQLSPPVMPWSPEAGTSAPVQVPERTPARRAPKRPANQPPAEPGREPAWPSWPLPEPGAGGSPALGPETGLPAAWLSPPPPADEREARTLEVAHDSDPALRAPSESSGPTAWPSLEVNLFPLVRARPEPVPFPEAGAFPEAHAFPGLSPGPDAEPGHEHDATADDEPVASAEPVTGGGHDAGPRSGSAPGPVRRHLAGLRPALGRKAGRAAAFVPPPAPDAPQATPDAPQATPDAEQSGPAWPQPPAPSAKARARWMLRAQPSPAEARAAEARAAETREEAEIREAATQSAEPPASPDEGLVPGTPDPATLVSQAPGSVPATPEPAAMKAEPAPSATGPAPSAPESASEAPEPAPAVAERAPAAPERASAAPEIAAEAPSSEEEAAAQPAEAPAPVAARPVGVERGRPLPSIERALSGPGSRGDASSWRRQVKVVAGGQGPGKRDQETLDRDRARLPLAAPSLIAVLGCTRGAGQTVTALMTSHILATVRGIAVAALDVNPGPTSLAARHAPAVTMQALLAEAQAPLAGHEPGRRPRRNCWPGRSRVAGST